MMPSGSMAEADELEGGSIELDSSESGRGVLAEELSMDSSESKKESNGEVSDGTGEGREDISDGENRNFVSIQPLGEGKERSEFKEEILRDDSLKSWRESADRKERGFKWRDGVLVLSKFVCWEQFRDVVVVPKSYRKRVLVVAHERLGHLGGENTLGMINKVLCVARHVQGCIRSLQRM